jgi:hypothetical protein
MFKAPNDMFFESKQGQGTFNFKGRIKGERIEATSLSAPELDSISSQIEDMRARICALSTGGDAVLQPATVSSSSSTSSDDILSQIQDVREQLRSADLPGLLAQMDELRTSCNKPSAPVVVPQAPPQISIQQLTKLQDQVTRLVGQMNTLQDRMSILEGRIRLEPSSSSNTNVIETITDVVVGAAANAVVNRAAMKLEDMVSPGALYNLRKVSERGPVKYAW